MKPSHERPHRLSEEWVSRLCTLLIVVAGCGTLPGWGADGEPDNPSGLIITVALDGSGDYTSIQAAINAGNPGRTVLVAPGTYKEPIRMRDGVNVQGCGADRTILDGRGSGPVVRGASYCRLDGFTITGYIDDNLDGIFCEDVNHFTISNNVIRYCTLSGINVVRSNVIVRNNVIHGNRCAGIFVTYPSPTPSSLMNNTIWNNRNEADITVWHGAHALVANNIMEDIDRDNESVTVVRHNNIVAEAMGADNMQADPLFADSCAGDFHLKSQAGRWDPDSRSWVQDDATSPCIDAGDPNLPTGAELSPNGGRVNMGAYGGTIRASRSVQPQTVLLPHVVYDFSWDIAAAQAFQSLLEAHGCVVTLTSLDDVAQTPLAVYHVVIVGNDTGYMSNWGDAQSVEAIGDYGKPLIGLGEGGYALFGRLGLTIGHPNGGHAQDNSIYVVDPNAALFNTLHPSAVGQGQILEVYTETESVSAALPFIPDMVVPFGRSATGSYSHYPLVLENGRYLLWGFIEPPDKMTDAGKGLFIDAVILAAGSAWDI